MKVELIAKKLIEKFSNRRDEAILSYINGKYEKYDDEL